MTKCAIFLSGKGSNFVNIIEKINLGKLPRTKISIVISNNRDCEGIQKAVDHGLDTFFIDKLTDYNNLEKILASKNFGIDYKKCINDKKIEDFVLEDRIEGVKKYNVSATPTIIINGEKFEKPLTYKNIEKTLKKLL